MPVERGAELPGVASVRRERSEDAGKMTLSAQGSGTPSSWNGPVGRRLAVCNADLPLDPV
jgi:hypothetical protein